MNGNILEHPTVTKRRQCRRLVGVLELTNDMVGYAKQGHWDKVAALEEERRDELNECFAYKITDKDSFLMSEALATVLHLNEELMSVVADARKSLIREQGDMTRTASQLNSYLDVGELG